jgi:hypothetical protein
MAKEVAFKTPPTEPTLQERLDGMSASERIEFLDNKAHTVKECDYRAPLNEEEIDEVKSQVTRLSVKMQELEDEKAVFTEDWKRRVKEVDAPLESLIREARTNERTGYGKVWEVVNREEKTVSRITEGNLIVGVRKALTEELEPRLFAS